MKKIKILYLIDTLEGYGAEKSLVEIAQNFKNVLPVFVHIYQGDMLKPKLESSGIKVYSLDINSKHAYKLAVEKLVPIYLKEKPEIVHATLFRSEIIARRLKMKFSEICLVGSFVSNAYSPERYRGKNFLQKLKLQYFQNVDQKTAHYVDYFISNSNTIKKATGKALGISRERIQVIYRGRNSAQFSSENLTDGIPLLNNQDKNILLNVSRLIPLKGQMDLLEALSLVVKDHSNVMLYFAGHGPYRSELEKYVLKSNLQDHVEFLGRIENINTLLHQSQIFIYPSYSEGLPGALIEAMMAERIIICSNIPENLECVDEDSALIFEKGNISQLSSKIIQVLKNLKSYKHLGEAARVKAQEKFELNNIVTSYEDFYHKIAAEKKMETLKVLHLIQQPQQRGAEMFTSQLANHQKKLGLNVKVVSVFNGEAELPFEDEIFCLNGNKSNRFLDFKAWKKLDEIIKGFQPDVVQANAGDTLKYAVFSKKFFKWKSPIVFRNASEVGRYLNSTFQREYNTYLYKNVDQIISVSKKSEKDLIDHFSFLKGKTQVLPVGLEKNGTISSFELEPAGHQHIVHVGGFSFEKNHKGLIKIFERVLAQKQHVHLHLVGDGPLRSEVEVLVKEKGLEESVHFYGFVNNPLSYIKGGDVLILPSVIEGLPGVLLEAMYCKTPVVAYDVGGISEIVSDKTGELIKSGDEEEFAKAIIQNLDHPQDVQINNAYNMVIENFMNGEIAREFIQTYEKVKDDFYAD